MIQHLPPKGFRMVRYYGIYARPVRAKIHALVATVLKNLVDCARKVAQYFASKNGKKADEYQKKAEERFGKGDVCCPECGEKMTLIKIWSKKRGVIYDAVEDGSRTSQDKVAQEKNAPGLIEQLSFGFLASLNHVRAW
jgi:transcription initiation factor IIE alpha subunit